MAEERLQGGYADGAVRAGDMVRRQVVAGFVPPPGAVWRQAGPGHLA